MIGEVGVGRFGEEILGSRELGVEMVEFFKGVWRFLCVDYFLICIRYCYSGIRRKILVFMLFLFGFDLKGFESVSNNFLIVFFFFR